MRQAGLRSINNARALSRTLIAQRRTQAVARRVRNLCGSCLGLRHTRVLALRGASHLRPDRFLSTGNTHSKDCKLVVVVDGGWLREQFRRGGFTFEAANVRRAMSKLEASISARLKMSARIVSGLAFVSERPPSSRGGASSSVATTLEMSDLLVRRLPGTTSASGSSPRSEAEVGSQDQDQVQVQDQVQPTTIKNVQDASQGLSDVAIAAELMYIAAQSPPADPACLKGNARRFAATASSKATASGAGGYKDGAEDGAGNLEQRLDGVVFVGDSRRMLPALARLPLMGRRVVLASTPAQLAVTEGALPAEVARTLDFVSMQSWLQDIDSIGGDLHGSEWAPETAERGQAEASKSGTTSSNATSSSATAADTAGSEAESPCSAKDISDDELATPQQLADWALSPAGLATRLAVNLTRGQGVDVAQLLGSEEAPVDGEESLPSDSQQTARAIAGDSWLLRGMRGSKLSARQLLRENGELFRLSTSEAPSGTKRGDSGAFEVRVNLQELKKRLRLASKQRLVPSATPADKTGQHAAAARQAPTAEHRADASEPADHARPPSVTSISWKASKQLAKTWISHCMDELLASITSTRVGAAIVALQLNEWQQPDGGSTSSEPQLGLKDGSNVLNALLSPSLLLPLAPLAGSLRHTPGLSVALQRAIDEGKTSGHELQQTRDSIVKQFGGEGRRVVNAFDEWERRIRLLVDLVRTVDDTVDQLQPRTEYPESWPWGPILQQLTQLPSKYAGDTEWKDGIRVAKEATSLFAGRMSSEKLQQGEPGSSSEQDDRFKVLQPREVPHGPTFASLVVAIGQQSSSIRADIARIAHGKGAGSQAAASGSHGSDSGSSDTDDSDSADPKWPSEKHEQVAAVLEELVNAGKLAGFPDMNAVKIYRKGKVQFKREALEAAIAAVGLPVPSFSGIRPHTLLAMLREHSNGQGSGASTAVCTAASDAEGASEPAMTSSLPLSTKDRATGKEISHRPESKTSDGAQDDTRSTASSTYTAKSSSSSGLDSPSMAWASQEHERAAVVMEELMQAGKLSSVPSMKHALRKSKGVYQLKKAALLSAIDALGMPKPSSRLSSGGLAAILAKQRSQAAASGSHGSDSGSSDTGDSDSADPKWPSEKHEQVAAVLEKLVNAGKLAGFPDMEAVKLNYNGNTLFEHQALEQAISTLGLPKPSDSTPKTNQLLDVLHDHIAEQSTGAGHADESSESSSSGLDSPSMAWASQEHERAAVVMEELMQAGKLSSVPSMKHALRKSKGVHQLKKAALLSAIDALGIPKPSSRLSAGGLAAILAKREVGEGEKVAGAGDAADGSAAAPASESSSGAILGRNSVETESRFSAPDDSAACSRSRIGQKQGTEAEPDALIHGVREDTQVEVTPSTDNGDDGSGGDDVDMISFLMQRGGRR